MVCICLALHFGWTAHLGFGYLWMIPDRLSLVFRSRYSRTRGVYVYVWAGERLLNYLLAHPCANLVGHTSE